MKRLGKYLTSLTKPELEELKEALNLTDEEEKIFVGLAKGYNANMIADRNNISDRTMSRRIEQIYGKIEKLKGEKNMNKKDVPLNQKYNLTLDEAAIYFNTSAERIKEIASENEMIIKVGVKNLVRRKDMESYMDKARVL